MNKFTGVITIGAAGCPWWQEFKTDVSDLLNSIGCVIVQRPWLATPPARDALGEWEGQAEAAATFVFFGQHPQQAVSLREGLREIAAAHRQEAIGFIWVQGTDHLIEVNSHES